MVKIKPNISTNKNIAAFSLNEAAKVSRTIDPKLWATVSSACSRKYKATMGEDAIPPVKDDMQTLMARYVAGLIIFKQPCPQSLADIDKIGAFKQYAHKLLNNMGCTLYDIQVLYNENCGNLPKAVIDDNTDDVFDNNGNSLSDDDAERISKEQKEMDKSFSSKADMSNSGQLQVDDLEDTIKNAEERQSNNIGTSDDYERAKETAAQNQKKTERALGGRAVDVSRIDKVEMDVDGTKQTIYPRRIALLTEAYLNDMLNDKDLKVFKKYFDKPIIWTFEISTAATDGVRLFFNPAFADKLFSLDAEYMKKKKELGHSTNGILGKAIQYVLIHEAYHQIYQHMIRTQMKAETANHPELHNLANIAQDVEINRDIENQLPVFQGMTKTINGCFDSRFPSETWEVIFDAYYSGQAEPPQGESGDQGDYDPNQQPNDSSGNGDGSGNGQSQPQEYSDDYKRGWAQAIQDIKDGKIQP